MRLLRDELYKLTNRRLVAVCFLAALLIELFCIFFGGVFLERSVVNGVEYKGVAAIKKDRELVKAYEGVLDDDKVENMAAEYGLLKYDVENYGDDHNFLNEMLYDNGLCDGNIDSWANVEQPSHTIPIALTTLGALTQAKGVQPELFYYNGWGIFETNLGIAGILSCLLLMVAVTPVFAEEYSSGAANILLTTVHGKGKDIGVRVGAAYIFSLGAFVLQAVFCLLVCGLFFGFGGAGSFYGMVHGKWYPSTDELMSASLLREWQFLLILTAFIVIGLLMLTAFSLFASAACRTPFVALIVTVLFFVLPGAVWFYLALTDAPVNEFTQRIWHILLCTPMYACMNGGVCEMLSAEAGLYRAVAFLVVSVPSLILVRQLFRRHQAA